MNSHIIPEFIYRPLYDAKHRFRSAQITERAWEWEQKGFREPLMCANCELKFSKLEHYASNDFFGRPLPTPQSQGRANAIVITGLDYARMKLFLLSVLWRAAAATHGFFRHVDLGPHEEKIRLLLMSDTPGSPDEYACFVCSLKFDGDVFRDFFVEPTPSRVSGHRCIRFVFSGFIFFYFVSSHPLPDSTSRLILQRSGQLVIADSELEEHPFLRHTFNGAKDAFAEGSWN